MAHCQLQDDFSPQFLVKRSFSATFAQHSDSLNNIFQAGQGRSVCLLRQQIICLVEFCILQNSKGMVM